MTLGGCRAPVTGVPGGHARAPPSFLSPPARPQHCLSDRPVLGPHGQLHFPRRLLADAFHHVVGSPGAEGRRASTAAPPHSGAATWAPPGKRLVLKAARAPLLTGKRRTWQQGPGSR